MSKMCENVAFEQLAQQFGTPLYVYSRAALDLALAHYRQAFADVPHLLCYAVKANGNLSILRHFADTGCGFDIVSGGELQRVLAAGGDAGKTVFSGVGKSRAEMAFALEAGVKCFNIESLPELAVLNEVAGQLGRTAPISLRINPDVDAQTHPYISTGLSENKFGIAMKEAVTAFAYARSLPHLHIIGVDCHIGSQLLDVAPLIEACQRLIVLHDDLAAQGIKLQHMDLGGGIGIAYQTDETAPDLRDYAQAVAPLLRQRDLQLILEPGRSLVGQAGTLLTRVEYIKQNGDKTFVIVDAAMNDLMRPALYQAHHHIENNDENTNKTFIADIVGPVCETGDFLAQNRAIAAQTGDLLLVRGAGAYGSSMASNYNTRPRAAEVLVDGAQYRLIRQRETIEQILANETACLTQ